MDFLTSYYWVSSKISGLLMLENPVVGWKNWMLTIERYGFTSTHTLKNGMSQFSWYYDDPKKQCEVHARFPIVWGNRARCCGKSIPRRGNKAWPHQQVPPGSSWCSSWWAIPKRHVPGPTRLHLQVGLGSLPGSGADVSTACCHKAWCGWRYPATVEGQNGSHASSKPTSSGSSGWTPGVWVKVPGVPWVRHQMSHIPFRRPPANVRSHLWTGRLARTQTRQSLWVGSWNPPGRSPTHHHGQSQVLKVLDGWGPKSFVLFCRARLHRDIWHPHHKATHHMMVPQPKVHRKSLHPSSVMAVDSSDFSI